MSAAILFQALCTSDVVNKAGMLGVSIKHFKLTRSPLTPGKPGAPGGPWGPVRPERPGSPGKPGEPRSPFIPVIHTHCQRASVSLYACITSVSSVSKCLP